MPSSRSGKDSIIIGKQTAGEVARVTRATRAIIRARGKGNKGDKKGKGDKVRQFVHGKTPDNRMLGFAWNNPGQGCRNPRCAMVHACTSCHGDHASCDKSCPEFRPARWQ